MAGQPLSKEAKQGLSRLKKDLLPSEWNFEKAAKEGYYQCNTCNSLDTSLVVEVLPNGASESVRKCNRCGSYRMKFRPPCIS